MMKIGALEIDSDYFIPPRPEMLLIIQDFENMPEPDMPLLADIISQDVGLAAIVIKTVNSPLYGLRSRVTDIKQGVMLLGSKLVSNLSMFYYLKRSMPIPPGIDMPAFWDNSTQTAFLASAVYGEITLRSDLPREHAYSAGLFLDCGIPVMAYRHDDYDRVIREAEREKDRTFTEIEDDHYDSNHAVVGYHVANYWDINSTIGEIILNHHNPYYLVSGTSSVSCKDLFCVLKIAENQLHEVRFKSPLPEWAQLSPLVTDYLALSEEELGGVTERVMELYDGQFGSVI